MIKKLILGFTMGVFFLNTAWAGGYGGMPSRDRGQQPYPQVFYEGPGSGDHQQNFGSPENLGATSAPYQYQQGVSLPYDPSSRFSFGGERESKGQKTAVYPKLDSLMKKVQSMKKDLGKANNSFMASFWGFSLFVFFVGLWGDISNGNPPDSSNPVENFFSMLLGSSFITSLVLGGITINKVKKEYKKAEKTLLSARSKVGNEGLSSELKKVSRFLRETSNMYWNRKLLQFLLLPAGFILSGALFEVTGNHTLGALPIRLIPYLGYTRPVHTKMKEAVKKVDKLLKMIKSL